MMTVWRRIPLGEVVRFGMVGGLSTALYLAFLAFFWHLFGLPLSAAAALAYGLGMTLNYVMQRGWTFRSNRSHRLAVPIFVFIHGIGMSLNAIVLGALVDGLGWSFIVGQSAALILVFAWSYLIQKFFVFNSSGPSASSRQKRCHGRIETDRSRQ
jgi:putative flippase GtrA